MPVDYAPTVPRPRLLEVADNLDATLTALHDAVAAQTARLDGSRRSAILRQKRASVDLPVAATGNFTWKRTGSEQLSEVVNQLATMTRLLDAMTWALSVAPDARVVHCNPTTSSVGSDLDIETNEGDRLAFEVSDTIARNANRKIVKDIGTLLQLDDRFRRLLATSGVNANYRPKGHDLTGLATIRSRGRDTLVVNGIPDDVEYEDTVILELSRI